MRVTGTDAPSRGRAGPSGIRAVDQAHDALLAFVRAAPAGTRLPSERDLGRRLGVSRPTMRDALSRLSYLGLIEVRHGGGTFVRAPDPERLGLPFRYLLERDPDAADELFALRAAIEPDLAARAAGRRTSSDVAALRAAVRRGRAALEAPGLEPTLAEPGSTGAAGSRDLREPAEAVFDRIAEIAGNRLCADVARTARLLTSEGGGGFPVAGARLALEQQATIVEAIVAGDADAARDAALVHLRTLERWYRAARAPSPHGGAGPEQGRDATAGPPDPTAVS